VTTNAIWQVFQTDVQLGSACDTTISQARAAVNRDKIVCQAHRFVHACCLATCKQGGTRAPHSTAHFAHARPPLGARYQVAALAGTPPLCCHSAAHPTAGGPARGQALARGTAPPRPTQCAPAWIHRVRCKRGASRLRRTCGPVSHPPHRARKPERGLGGHPAQARFLWRMPRVQEQPGVQLLLAGARATCPGAPSHSPILSTRDLGRRGGLGSCVWPPSARPAAGDRGSAHGA